MPTTAYLVYWKRNRNHRGRDVVFSLTKADAFVKKKQKAGFKAWKKLLDVDDPLVIYKRRYGDIPQP